MANLSNGGHDSHGCSDSVTSQSQSGGSPTRTSSALKPPLTYVESISQPYNHHQASAGRYETYAGRGEEDAVAQAVELSLAQQTASCSSPFSGTPEDHQVYQHDRANIKSYSSSLGTSIIASDSTTPQSALDNLSDSIDAAAEQLESCAKTKHAANPSLLARYLREWEAIITDVSQTLARAEEERIEAVQAQLDLDYELSERHQIQVDRLVRIWQERLRTMELEWARKLARKTDSFRAKLAEQKERHTADMEQQKHMHVQERDFANSS